MRTIKSKDELIKWAKEVNSGISLSRKCDIQDEYAHSNQSDIDKFFVECGNDKRLVLCSVHNTMAFEEVERLLAVLAKHKLNEMIRDEQTELDKRWSDLAKAESTLLESKRTIYRRIGQLQKENNRLKRRERYLEEESATRNNLLKTEKTLRRIAEEKADKYDNIKSLIA